MFPFPPGRQGPPRVAEGSRPARAGAKLIWIFYAPPRDWSGDPERRARMLDLIYLAAGLGFFAAMAAYARWAGRA
jgi:hypothetical protein